MSIKAAKSREEKMLRDVLVVKSSLIYTPETSWWFITANEVDFESKVIEHFEYQQRWKMEEDLDYQQPIPYVIIHNPEINKFVAYKRGSSESTSWEVRLFGKRSLWVWGHIERDQENEVNPMRSTAKIEIEEEIWLNDISDLKLLWYIRDKTVPVNLYHLWMVYLATTETKDMSVVDGEIEQVYFMTWEEIDSLMENTDIEMESWSKIAWDAYKDSLAG